MEGSNGAGADLKEPFSSKILLLFICSGVELLICGYNFGGGSEEEVTWLRNIATSTGRLEAV